MVDYAKLAATARRLIEANGRSVTLEQDDRTPSDPARPWLGPDDSGTVATAVVAFVPPGGGGFGRLLTIDPEIAKTIVQIGLLAHDSLPTTFDARRTAWVRDGARAFRVQFVDELAPGTVRLVYALGLAG